MTERTLHRIFITGGTGYLGGRLVPALLGRGQAVSLLIRPGSESKRFPGAATLVGNPLDEKSYRDRIAPADTFIHLVGVPKPAPWKGAQFRAIDLVSIRAAVNAAVDARIGHFIYVSVARPASVMKEYIAVRAEGERLIRAAGLSATIIRPWYILGPGHRWPMALLPVYRLLGQFPSTRETAERLGLVTLDQMIGALVSAVEHPPEGIRIIPVPEIRQFR
ncbi:MAG: NAD(P)H-binding protein [Nitrospirae bacterium]|nr:NAD(P)H-binding protein [Candidatus Manganitrophaceae bacterium]